jgi:hypothetical protein
MQEATGFTILARRLVSLTNGEILLELSAESAAALSGSIQFLVDSCELGEEFRRCGNCGATYRD